MEKHLMDMELADLNMLMEKWMQPPFRAKQAYQWLLSGVRPAQMSNIPKELREALQTTPWGGAVIAQSHTSSIGDTVKYLFELEDSALVEGVLMRYHHGNTLCLSTQVGCRMGCAFCASTLDGVMRNLRHGEMLSMVAAVEREENAPKGQRAVTNIVLMGSGEPLDNFEHVKRFLERACSQNGLKISPRNISLSTCGLVPQIYRMIEEMPLVKLCISLHASKDELRDTLVPANKKYPIAEVLKAARTYADKTKRRVIFEYALIDGVNDSKRDAQSLAALLKGIHCHINLIPLNPVEERGLKGVTRKHAAQFCKWLEELHASATVRREMGTDIEGACGQLRRRTVLNGR